MIPAHAILAAGLIFQVCFSEFVISFYCNDQDDEKIGFFLGSPVSQLLHLPFHCSERKR